MRLSGSGLTQMSPSLLRHPSGLRGVGLVSLGLVQRQVWRLRRAAPHPLHHNAPSQQRGSLPPAGGGEEVLPGQLFMTRPGQEGEEGEEEEERPEIQERKERKETFEEPQKICGLFARGVSVHVCLSLTLGSAALKVNKLSLNLSHSGRRQY